MIPVNDKHPLRVRQTVTGQAVLALMVSTDQKGQVSLAKAKSHMAGCGPEQLTATHPFASPTAFKSCFKQQLLCLLKRKCTVGPPSMQGSYPKLVLQQLKKKINKAFTEGKQKDRQVGFEYLLQLKRLMTIWWWDLSRLMETLPSCA